MSVLPHHIGSLAMGFVLVLGPAADSARSQTRGLPDRQSGSIRTGNGVQKLSFSRYSPIFRIRGIGEWGAPRTSYTIDGVSHSAFPLGMATPEYLPVDILTLDTLKIIRRPTISGGNRSPGGQVGFRRTEIPDEFSMSGRISAGSETGDPSLQKYTRDSLALHNKNKIGPFAAGTLSDRIGGLAYRLTAGLFGYFSSGYVDIDPLFRLYDRTRWDKTNANILFSAELEHTGENGGTILGDASALGIVGWEQMPFLPHFMYVEGLVDRSGVEYRDERLSVRLRREGTSLRALGSNFAEGGRFSISVYEVTPSLNVPVPWAGTLTLNAGLTQHLLSVPAGQNQLFTVSRTLTSWTVGGAIERSGADEPEYAARVRYDRHFLSEGAISGEATFSVTAGGGHDVGVSFSSVASFPAPVESYGHIRITRVRPSPVRVDTFLVTGSTRLQPARVTGFEISHRYVSPDGDWKIETTPFAQMHSSPIGRVITSSVRTQHPGDVVVSAYYANKPNQRSWGFDVRGEWRILAGLRMKGDFEFFENSAILSYPRHQGELSARIGLGPSTVAMLSVAGIGRTVWEEFRVTPANDDRYGTGLDGVLAEWWGVDFSLYHRLGKFWFARDLELRLEIQNFLNRPFRFLPNGNPMEAAVIVHLFTPL